MSRLLNVFPSLFGQRLGGKFSLVTILCVKGILWQVGAVCVGVVGKQGIISYCIAMLPLNYGASFFNPLGFTGCLQGG